MLTLIQNIGMFLRMRTNDEGATAVEYGLMIALIAAAIVGTVLALGGHLSTLFGNVDSHVSSGATSAVG